MPFYCLNNISATLKFLAAGPPAANFTHSYKAVEVNIWVQIIYHAIKYIYIQCWQNETCLKKLNQIEIKDRVIPFLHCYWYNVYYYTVKLKVNVNWTQIIAKNLLKKIWLEIEPGGLSHTKRTLYHWAQDALRIIQAEPRWSYGSCRYFPGRSRMTPEEPRLTQAEPGRSRQSPGRAQDDPGRAPVEPRWIENARKW
jgi:hypothetical protein